MWFYKYLNTTRAVTSSSVWTCAALLSSPASPASVEHSSNEQLVTQVGQSPVTLVTKRRSVETPQQKRPDGGWRTVGTPTTKRTWIGRQSTTSQKKKKRTPQKPGGLKTHQNGVDGTRSCPPRPAICLQWDRGRDLRLELCADVPSGCDDKRTAAARDEPSYKPTTDAQSPASTMPETKRHQPSTTPGSLNGQRTTKDVSRSTKPARARSVQKPPITTLTKRRTQIDHATGKKS